MQNNKTITILVIEPNQRAYIKKIENTPASLQKLVGCNPEINSPFDDGVAILSCQEGYCTNNHFNRMVRDENGKCSKSIWGTFVIIGLDIIGYRSLTDNEMEIYLRKFKFPEKMLNVSGNTFWFKEIC